MKSLTDAEIIKALQAENEALEQDNKFKESIVRTSWFLIAICFFIIIVESLALIFIIVKK